MPNPKKQLQTIHKLLMLCAILLGIAIVAGVTRDRWMPRVRLLVGQSTQPASMAAEEASHEHEEAHEDEHNHDHAGHDEASSIELSANGLKNIGFEPFEVQVSDFEKKLTLPAIVAERPGRSRIHITASITGVVTEIFAVEGQAVEEDSPLFELRITNEDVVTAQRDFLRTSENLNVVNRELARLNALPEGVVPGKRILEQEYEKQKLEASLLAEQQALVVHGLSEEQVKNILDTRQLLRTITISAPNHTHEDDGCEGEHLFHVQSLPVSQGEQVATGQELAVLADHCELFVEGRAFENDAARLREAAREGWNVEGVLLVGDKQKEVINGLKLLYLADHIDPESRAFRFYLRLPNEIVLDQRPFPGRRFIEWRFKPGQRMELLVPVERWEKQLVLPVNAIVDEGAEAYAYRQNGDHFDRVAVHVEYRDRDAIVVANNGALFPGDIIAGQGAYQMHLALKNKAGGGVDPHAGHNH
jgi:multidrug efflux pump subunit AcrA (membrane-fusion protein)